MGLMSQFSGSLIGGSGFNLGKIANLVSCFSTIQSPLSVFCCFLFAVFIKRRYTTSSFPFNYHKKLITYTANNQVNPKLIPELLNNLGGKASDVMLNHLHKIKLFWPRNYYNDNKKITIVLNLLRIKRYRRMS